MHQCVRARSVGRARETAFESESFEFGGAGGGELGSLLSEAEEVELAMELMAVSSEAEMEQFLGNVFKKVWRWHQEGRQAAGRRSEGGRQEGPAVRRQCARLVHPNSGRRHRDRRCSRHAPSARLSRSNSASSNRRKRSSRWRGASCVSPRPQPSRPDRRRPRRTPRRPRPRPCVSAARQHLPGADLRALGASTGRLSGRWYPPRRGHRRGRRLGRRRFGDGRCARHTRPPYRPPYRSASGSGDGLGRPSPPGRDRPDTRPRGRSPLRGRRKRASSRTWPRSSAFPASAPSRGTQTICGGARHGWPIT